MTTSQFCAQCLRKCEEGVGDVVDLRIDVEERDVPARRSPARHAAGSQADDAKALVGSFRKQLHHVADRSSLVIVGQRLAHQFLIETFETVQRIAVQQSSGIAGDIQLDAFDSKEVASRVDEGRASIKLR
jgi:hypothetical protein